MRKAQCEVNDPSQKTGFFRMKWKLISIMHDHVSVDEKKKKKLRK